MNMWMLRNEYVDAARQIVYFIQKFLHQTVCRADSVPTEGNTQTHRLPWHKDVLPEPCAGLYKGRFSFQDKKLLLRTLQTKPMQ